MGVGDGIGVGVGVGVGLCAKPGVAADIIATNATAIAIATRRTRSNPVVCRVPEGCDGQLMTTNPEAKWRRAKMQHERRSHATICAELLQRVNRLGPPDEGDCSRLWFRGHRSEIADGHFRLGS